MFTVEQKQSRFDVISLILHDMYKITEHLTIDITYKKNTVAHSIFCSDDSMESRIKALQSLFVNDTVKYVLFTFSQNRELQFGVNLSENRESEAKEETVSRFLSNSFDYNIFSQGKENHQQFHEIIHNSIDVVKQRNMDNIRVMRKEVIDVFLRAVRKGEYLDNLVEMTYELANDNAIDSDDTLDSVVATYFAGSEKATKEWYDWFDGKPMG